MNLEDEKKLVAEKLMGWEYILRAVWEDGVMKHDNWNPQDNDLATCKQWDEIWGKMDDSFFQFLAYH